MTRGNGFNRRGFLTAGGALATTLGLGTTLGLARAGWGLGLGEEARVCPLSAEQETGPYYLGGQANRANLVEGRPGAPLSLRILVLDARSCDPVPNAAVELWHCDALGIYSGFTKVNATEPVVPPGGAGVQPTDRLTFLRGMQITDPQGGVRFRTIFPGVTLGRTNHMHFKVRVAGRGAARGSAYSYRDGHVAHTGQIFFPEELATSLMQQEPYDGHEIARTAQAEDPVFRGEKGNRSIARVDIRGAEIDANGMPEGGLHADFVVTVDPTSVPGPVDRGPEAAGNGNG